MHEKGNNYFSRYATLFTTETSILSCRSLASIRFLSWLWRLFLDLRFYRIEIGATHLPYLGLDVVDRFVKARLLDHGVAGDSSINSG